MDEPQPSAPDIAAFKATPKTHPMLASLPAHLKDPANFEKIQKAILETLSTTCSHAEVVDWAECTKCTKKMVERRYLLKNLGFKNPDQYMAWRKTHEEIKRRYPLMNWETKQPI